MAIPSTVAVRVVASVSIAFQTIPTQLEVDAYLLAYAEGVQDTNAVVHSVCVVRHRTSYTSTSEGNEIPNTVRIVTTQHVAQVEQHVLVQCPVLVTVAIVVVVGNVFAPDT